MTPDQLIAACDIAIKLLELQRLNPPLDAAGLELVQRCLIRVGDLIWNHSVP